MRMVSRSWCSNRCSDRSRSKTCCATPPVSPTASTATTRFGNSMPIPICSRASSTMMSLRRGLRNSRPRSSQGTRWDYGHSTDVLGRVIEVISGRTLYEFEKTKLFDPLGMNETAFFVGDPAQRPRIAQWMPGDGFDRPLAGIRDPTLPRRWQSGGAGLVGTIGDYARFAQMLLNGGTLNGRRYLKPETIALMASDHIGPETGIARDQFYFPGANSGFGLGFAVRTSVPDGTSWPLGEYRWDGVAGTFFFVDPRDDMFAIFMIQAPSQAGRIQLPLKGLIYEALER